MLHFIAFFCLFISNIAYGNDVALSHHGKYSLPPHVSYFETQNQLLEFSDVLSADSDIHWVKNTKDNLNFGFNDGVYWLKIALQNDNQQVHEWALEFGYAQLDQVEIYLMQNQKVIQYQSGGDIIPFKEKTIEYPHTVFPLHLLSNEQYDLYIRVESSGAIQIPMTIWEWDHFNQYTLKHFLLQGLFFGFVIIMALYNFMVWTTERQSIYLNYVIYIITFAIFQSSLSGIGFQFLWPNDPWVNKYITVISLSITFASFNYFMNDFFNIKETSLTLHKILNILFYGYLVFSVVSIFLPYYTSIISISTAAIFNISLIIFITLYMLKVRHASGKYFAFAWGSFVIGSALLTLNKFGFIPANPINEYTLQFGAGFEMIFLSLALAERMSRSQKEALLLANQVIEERERTFIAELENLKLEKQATQELEKIVEDRTKKLTQALEHLSIAHDKLQTISITDALTELNNRYYFNEHFKIEYKRAFREKTECSLIMLDVDHFKSVNDTYGHPAGDVCLKYIADCIKTRAARDSDICCRYGGEEFVIILPATPLIAAYDLADDIRQKIQSQPVHWEKIKINLTASFGVSSVIPVKSDDKHRQYLINQADQALYQAKHFGRNRVVMFEPEVL